MLLQKLADVCGAFFQLTLQSVTPFFVTAHWHYISIQGEMSEVRFCLKFPYNIQKYFMNVNLILVS